MGRMLQRASSEDTNLSQQVQPLLKSGGFLSLHGPESTSVEVLQDLGSQVKLAAGMTIVRPKKVITRISDNSRPARGKSIRWVSDIDSDVQFQIASQLTASLQAHDIQSVQIMSLKDAACSRELETAVFVVLLEIYLPFLYGIQREYYHDLQILLLSASDIIWVNFDGGTDTGHPEFFIVHGLARVLRNEREAMEFTIISLEACAGLSEEQCRNFLNILVSKHIKHDPIMADSEYLEINGVFCVPRISVAVKLSRQLERRCSKQGTSSIAICDAPPPLVELGTPGLLDTLRFIECPREEHDLQPGKIEIEVKAVGLNFRDCLAALGQLPNAAFGQECARIVIRTASTSFTKGDHVIVIGIGGIKTMLRSKATHAFNIPKHMPFATAAATPVQLGTAREVTHRVARVQKGKGILIHAGAGGTGQALIQVALSLGAVVFATVSSQTKKDVLIKTYNIQESNIFYSRDTSFAQGIRRVTDGKGVDVVINCLSGDSLLASWEYLAPYGRFVEIGLKDIMLDAKLPMMKFSSNTSFHGFDGSLWIRNHVKVAREGLEDVINQFSLSTLHPPELLIKYEMSEVEKALRSIQGGTSAGKAIVEISQNCLVSVSSSPDNYRTLACILPVRQRSKHGQVSR